MRGVRVVRVTDLQGVQWQVSVCWRPRHRALVRRIGGWRRDKRKDRDNGLDNLDPFSGIDAPDAGGCVEDIAIGFAIVVAVIVSVGVFWWGVLPLLLLLLDGLNVLTLRWRASSAGCCSGGRGAWTCAAQGTRCPCPASAGVGQCVPAAESLEPSGSRAPRSCRHSIVATGTERSAC